MLRPGLWFRSLSLSLVLTFATACAIAASTEPFALLASVKGKVDVTTSRGETARASFGRALERGDKVAVASGGAATIYFSDGNVIELSEKSTVTVGGKVASKTRVGPASAGVYTQVAKVVTGGSRQTGLVAMAQMRSTDERAPLITAPRKTDVMTERPGFTWRALEGATRYRVTLSGDAGELWSRDVAGTSLAYPADAPPLARDADYLWSLDAYSGADRVAREESLFHVVSNDAFTTVQDDVARIADSAGGAESSASRFLAGSYLLGRGLYQDAASQFEALCRMSPDAPGPHEALGNSYRAMGLMDQAAAEYQRALELTRAQ